MHILKFSRGAESPCETGDPPAPCPHRVRGAYEQMK